MTLKYIQEFVEKGSKALKQPCTVYNPSFLRCLTYYILI